MSEHPLLRILNPRSIAFVGASNNPQTMGTMHLNTLMVDGFAGPIYPVHPTEETVLGLKAWPDISSLPEAPDLLVVLVNREMLIPLIEEAGKKGIRRAVIISGGFAESEDHGPELQQQLFAACEKYQIRVIGPNCIGVMNPWAKLNVTYFPYRGQGSDIGLLSHSGTYLCHMYEYLQRRGFGLAEGLSLGNELNIDLVDGIEYMAADDNVKAICMYVESLRRPRRFIEAARRASRKKPLVAFHVGSTEAGSRAVASHTAALSGAKGILAGALDQAGVIRTRGIQQLFDYAGALAKMPPMKGKRVAVFTNSGGPGATAAEIIERVGLSCPELSPETQQKLLPYLPHTASAKNPVDMTYFKDIGAFFVKVPRILLEDPHIDGLIMYGAFGVDFWESLKDTPVGTIQKGFDFTPIREGMNMLFDKLAALPHKYDKPLIVVNFDGFADDGTKALRDRGVPVIESPERGVQCLWALHQYHKIRNR